MPPITTDTGMVQYHPQMDLEPVIDHHFGYDVQYLPAYHTGVSHEQPLEVSQQNATLGHEDDFLAGSQRAFTGDVISQPLMDTSTPMSPIATDTGMVQYHPQMYLGPVIDDHSEYNVQYSPAYKTGVSHHNPTEDHGSFVDRPISFNNLPLSPSTQGDSPTAPPVLTTSSEQALGASSLAPLAEASTTHTCHWFDRNESPCHGSIIADRSDAAQHLRDHHGVKRNSSLVTCLWDGCMKRMRGDSLSRHIVNLHMNIALDA
ncbi:hypothetical protein BV22DRAFT_1051365 [Leucogyrophana mollusca]|uniref:Uncharacterized protein n=1 Tax=Leucogyrophana mollusca TaxID=85980 RepID=A0ACB8B1L4_9AGAM|nr:hypothetical protein BV22DRAFT_1051365 [Leucogyrophana mollusca]